MWLLVVLLLLAPTAWADVPGYSGSGFVFAHKGQHSFLLTNHHVIDRCGSIVVDTIEQHRATPIAADDVNDLAVLKTPRLEGRATAVFREDELRLAEPIYALGYPLADLLSRSVKISRGIVNAHGGIYNDPRYVQIDAIVQPGSSGGPITDMDGKVAGVTTAIINPSKYKMVQRVGFALKTKIVRRFLDKVHIGYDVDGARTPEELASMSVPIKCSPGDLKVRNIADEEQARLEWLPITAGMVTVRLHHGQLFTRTDFADCEGRYGADGFNLTCGERIVSGVYDADRNIFTGLDDDGNLFTICVGRERCPRNPFRTSPTDRAWTVHRMKGGEEIAMVETNFGRIAIACQQGRQLLVISHLHHYDRPFIGLAVDDRRQISLPSSSSLPPTPTETSSTYIADLPERLLRQLRQGERIEVFLNGDPIGRIGLRNSAATIAEICE